MFVNFLSHCLAFKNVCFEDISEKVTRKFELITFCFLFLYASLQLVFFTLQDKLNKLSYKVQ